MAKRKPRPKAQVWKNVHLVYDENTDGMVIGRFKPDEDGYTPIWTYLSEDKTEEVIGVVTAKLRSMLKRSADDKLYSGWKVPGGKIIYVPDELSFNVWAPSILE